MSEIDFTCPLCGGEIDLEAFIEDNPEIWSCNKCNEKFIIENGKFIPLKNYKLSNKIKHKFKEREISGK